MKIIDLDAHKRRLTAGGENPVTAPDMDAQARSWVIRLDSGEMSEAEQHALADWLEQDEAHRRKLNALAASWMALDELSVLLDQLPQSHNKEFAPVADTAQGSATGWKSFRLTNAAMALALLLVLLLPLGLWINHNSMVFPAREFISAVGEVRDIGLPDKSQINLNSGSLMTVSYDKNARFVHLLDGEAYFEVASNPDVPFVVYAGDYLVRAVGTQFSVSHFQNNLDVIVTEGKVQVSRWQGGVATLENLAERLDAQDDAATSLGVGQKGVFLSGTGELESVQELATVNLNKTLAWRDGMLIFDNDSLETVVEEINRYTSGRIVISDSRLSDLRFGGYFRIGDIDAILAAMVKQYAIVVEEINDGLYYLSSREQ